MLIATTGASIGQARPIEAADMAYTPSKGPRRERLDITALDFRVLADLAWRKDPQQGLAKQMSFALGVSEKACQGWLNDDPSPPIDVIAQAIPLADAAMVARAGALDRIHDALKAHRAKAEQADAPPFDQELYDLLSGPEPARQDPPRKTNNSSPPEPEIKNPFAAYAARRQENHFGKTVAPPRKAGSTPAAQMPSAADIAAIGKNATATLNAAGDIASITQKASEATRAAKAIADAHNSLGKMPTAEDLAAIGKRLDEATKAATALPRGMFFQGPDKK